VKLARKIVKIMEDRNPDLAVRRAQIGLCYCAVELDSGEAGVAYSFPRKGCGPSLRTQGRRIGGTPFLEAVRLLGSENLSDSAIAIAAINAFAASVPFPPATANKAGEGAIRAAAEGAYIGENRQNVDILEALDLREGDRVCMVGCFFPLIEKLRTRKIEVQAVDLDPKPGALPAESVSELLPKSQIALITATAVINGTIDGLLEMTGNCREVAVLGPSTPLFPQAFEGTPVTCLAGIRVNSADEVFEVIAEGGGFREFKRHTTKVTIRVAAPR
jgi:uncharacterized protein (DUF4213/DUF364 family)